MPTFTARVALFAANRIPGFERLDVEMNKKHFTKTINYITTSVKFPYEEFRISGNYTLNQVLDLAVKAAANTSGQYALFVSGAEEERN